MSVAHALEAAKAARRGALIGYLPIGFPSRESTVPAALAIAEAGAQVIELGVPYTDPVMDGPVIQAATTRALENGFRLEWVCETVARISDRVDTPLVIMSYFNPLYQYGLARFASDLSAAGGCGVIIPDLIPEEADEWVQATDEAGLERVFLAAPSSRPERLRQTIMASNGFVYAQSTMGVTGERARLDAAAEALVHRLRAEGAERVCVGVGISTPEHVSAVLKYADGAIVGSALVAALANSGVAGLATLTKKLAADTK